MQSRPLRHARPGGSPAVPTLKRVPCLRQVSAGGGGAAAGRKYDGHAFGPRPQELECRALSAALLLGAIATFAEDRYLAALVERGANGSRWDAECPRAYHVRRRGF